jgi:hypothetical protein
MHSKFFLQLGVALLPVGSMAQYTATFAVVQPPQFQVDAGEDLVFEPGLTLQAAATGGTSTYGYQWSPAQYLDDPNSPAPVVQDLLASTTFTVQVTDLGLGCVLTDEVFVDFSVGIPSALDAALKLSPNPSGGLVRIQAPAVVEHVVIHSPKGAMVMEYRGMSSRDLSLDVSPLPAGVYFLTIELVDGRRNTQRLCTTSAH